MKIYDCFQFFNEFDVLEIRLDTLYDYVDYFVISETNRTHSNLDKPYYFEENKHLFEKYMDKIIHIKEEYPEDILHFKKRQSDDKYSQQYNLISDIYDKEENENDLKKWPNFCRDYLQREYIKLGLIDCQDDDLIMVSDLDEISNPEVVKNIKENRLTKKCLLQNCYYYYVNVVAHTNWYGAYVVEYKDTKDVSLTHLRNESKRYDFIYDAGWHFSFVGGAERVKNKIISYSHQEFNNPWVLNQIDFKMKQNQDPFGRGNNTYHNPIQEFYYENMKITDMSECPDRMVELIKNKFPYLIKKV
jgi:beta-1,4-mannosyl-glycoprotein beta-1,4-N-acetylglucosaminyltransferase